MASMALGSFGRWGSSPDGGADADVMADRSASATTYFVPPPVVVMVAVACLLVVLLLAEVWKLTLLAVVGLLRRVMGLVVLL